MSTVARRRGVLAWVWFAVCAVLLLRLVSCSPTAGTAGSDRAAIRGGGGALVASSTTLRIDGDLTGPVSPGVTAPLDLRLSNTQGVPVGVTHLSVKVEAVSAPSTDAGHPCTVDDFTVTQPPSAMKFTLTPHQVSSLSGLGISRVSWPTVGMLDRPADQDGCKGASLTLSYAAAGTPQR